MSKKRKDPPQSTTLLNFFASGTAAGSCKNKRRVETDAPSSFRPPLVKKESYSQEVIVIESDDEVEVELGGQSSDVEILEEARPFKRERTILRETCAQVACDGPPSKRRNYSQTAGAGAPKSRHDENSFSSGEEFCSSVRSDRAECRQPHREKANDSEISELRSKFYEKTSTPEPIPAPSVSKLPSLIECRSTCLKDEEEELDLMDAPDVWDMNMGDDELSFMPQDQTEDSYEDIGADTLVPKVENNEAFDSSKSIESCPMCGMTFVNLDPSNLQKHVNNCLDTPSTSAPQPTTSSSSAKPLRPLSSFFTSAGPFVSSPTPRPTTKLKSSNANAFSVLMSSHDERAAWDEVQENEDRSFKPTKANRRKAPFYKVLQGMPIAVDAFRYGAIPEVTAYFLTHAHSDHYTNLSSNWKNGLIYCSETTANLVVHMLSVDRKWVCPLPMDTPTEIPDTGGVKVTLIEANHCPGSCLFFFEGLQTVNAGDSSYKSPFVGSNRTFRYLHCGDFRACPQHVLHPAVKGKRIDHVYLDTTYLNPKYCFPPQPLVVAACAELARRIVNGEPLDEQGASEDGKNAAGKGSIQGWIKVDETRGKGKQKVQGCDNVLIVVGTYTIGKERIVKAIAQALNTKIYCDARKTAILHCQDDPELHALLTSKPLEAGVHVVPLGMVASDRFKDYMARWKGRWTRAVAFRPTGWTYAAPAGTDLAPSIASVLSRAQARRFTHAHLQPARSSTAQLVQYGVPYSEHSSFPELTCFALSLDWGRMIATVNVGSAASRAKMQKWVERWEAERKRRRESGEPGVVKFRSADYW